MDPIGDFLLTLLHGVTNAHLLHWIEKDYGKHRTLGKFYEKLQEATDELAEGLMGCYNLTPTFPQTYYHPAESGEAELMALKAYVEENRENLPQESQIQTLIDNVMIEIDQALFLIRLK
jgi:DNA-binding ferritin-like protein